jgi:hypothetical protein
MQRSLFNKNDNLIIEKFRENFNVLSMGKIN